MKNSNDVKIHYRMYKKGKQWMFASITTSSLALGFILLGNGTASATNEAIEIPTNESTTTEVTTSAPTDTTNSDTITTPINEPIEEKIDTPTEQDNVAEASTEPASVEKPVLLEEPASLEEPVTIKAEAPAVASPTTTQQQSIKSAVAKIKTKPAAVAKIKTAVSNTKPVKKNVTKAATKAIATTKAQEDYITHVDKNNFEQYFNLNGDAQNQYNKENGTVTLTPNENDQSGNFTLKNQIDFSKSFKLTGAVNLGTGAMDTHGDGIGFGFHAEEPTKTGNIGGTLGIGNLLGGFGFKLDTYYNGDGHDGFKNEYFTPDPSNLEDKPFGAFIYNEEQIVSSSTTNGGDIKPGDIALYTHTYTGNEIEASPQQIDVPADNLFKDIVFEYNEATKTMKVSFEDKIWEKNITDWLTPNQNGYSFIVSASTGAATNLQQFQIKEFDYVVYSKFNALFQEKDTGQSLHNPEAFDGKINEKLVDYSNPINRVLEELYAQGFDYVETNKEDAGSEFNSTVLLTNNLATVTNDVTLTQEHGQVIYLFEKANGNVTVKFVDEKGQSIPNVSTVNETGKVGDKLTNTSKIDIENYEFLRIEDGSDDPTGVFKRTPQEIIYVYKQKDTTTPPEATDGKLIVNYVDESNAPLLPSTSTSGKIGDKFPSTGKDIPGYTLTTITGNPDGAFTKEDQTITYVYKKEDTTPVTPPINPPEATDGKLIVNYVDESNTPLLPSTSTDGKIGDKFPSTGKDVPGYTLTTITGNPDGAFTKEDQTITYVYKKDPEVLGELIVHYVDESNNPIAPSQTHEGKIGDKFPSTGKDIPGYTLTTITGNPDGAFTKEDQSITYVYKKDPAPNPGDDDNNENQIDDNDDDTDSPGDDNGDNNNTDDGQDDDSNTPGEGNGDDDDTNVDDGQDDDTGTDTRPTIPTNTTGGSQTPDNAENQTNSTTTNVTTLQNPAQASMLPQTGDAATQTSLMGGMLLALSALAGVFGLRKRKAEK